MAYPDHAVLEGADDDLLRLDNVLSALVVNPYRKNKLGQPRDGAFARTAAMGPAAGYHSQFLILALIALFGREIPQALIENRIHDFFFEELFADAFPIGLVLASLGFAGFADDPFLPG